MSWFSCLYNASIYPSVHSPQQAAELQVNRTRCLLLHGLIPGCSLVFALTIMASSGNVFLFWTTSKCVIRRKKNKSTKTFRCHHFVRQCVVLGGRGALGNFSLSHLVWAGVVVRASANDKELPGAAGHSRGADGLLHGGHLCPPVGEGVVTLHAAQPALPVVAANSVDLRRQRQLNNSSGGNYEKHIFFPRTWQLLIFHLLITMECASGPAEPVCRLEQTDDALLHGKHHELRLALSHKHRQEMNRLRYLCSTTTQQLRANLKACQVKKREGE